MCDSQQPWTGTGDESDKLWYEEERPALSREMTDREKAWHKEGTMYSAGKRYGYFRRKRQRTEWRAPRLVLKST